MGIGCQRSSVLPLCRFLRLCNGEELSEEVAVYREVYPTQTDKQELRARPSSTGKLDGAKVIQATVGSVIWR